MTVLIDFSQLAFASFFINQQNASSDNFFKYLVLNMLRKIIMTTHPDEVVLCTDYKSWRKKVFSLYKYSRKARVGDAKELYSLMDSFIEEMRVNFPYKVVRVEYAEGDDCIAILSQKLQGDIVAVSSDKDLQQLVRKGVQIYNPFKDMVIKDANPQQLEELYIYGDSGDGIPNILSRDEIFTVENERQKSITKKLLLEIHNSGGVDAWAEGQSSDIQKNLERNKKLIGLTLENIPFEIQTEVLKQYFESKPINSGKKIAEYFNAKEMNSFSDCINEFLMGGVTYEVPFVDVPLEIEEDKDLSGLFE